MSSCPDTRMNQSSLVKSEPQYSIDYSNTACGVCWDSFQHGQGNCGLCGHWFCSECWSQLSNNNKNTCPQCRKPLREVREIVRDVIRTVVQEVKVEVPVHVPVPVAAKPRSRPGQCKAWVQGQPAKPERICGRLATRLHPYAMTFFNYCSSHASPQDGIDLSRSRTCIHTVRGSKAVPSHQCRAKSYRPKLGLCKRHYQDFTGEECDPEDVPDELDSELRSMLRAYNKEMRANFQNK